MVLCSVLIRLSPIAKRHGSALPKGGSPRSVTARQRISLQRPRLSTPPEGSLPQGLSMTTPCHPKYGARRGRGHGLCTGIYHRCSAWARSQPGRSLCYGPAWGLEALFWLNHHQRQLFASKLWPCRPWLKPGCGLVGVSRRRFLIICIWANGLMIQRLVKNLGEASDLIALFHDPTGCARGFLALYMRRILLAGLAPSSAPDAR